MCQVSASYNILCPYSLPHSCLLAGVAGASATPSPLPNGVSAANGRTKEEEKAGAKISLEDLFKDVWMAEEEEEAEHDSAAPSHHEPHTEVLLLLYHRCTLNIPMHV